MASAVYYIADIDSLRFALSLEAFDLLKLQPHFPGYPVFCFLAKLIYSIVGSYALTFSLIGGVSVFILIWAMLTITGWIWESLEGKILVVLIAANPLLWLMSNRYMPDMMGLACLFAAYALLRNPENRRAGIGGFVLVGLLAGIRLSYLPFLLPIVALSFWQKRQKGAALLAGIIGVAVWLIPLVLVTGWENLIYVAQKQTSGHFYEFGGSHFTEASWTLRAEGLLEGIVADGLGGYWPGRHWVTAVSIAGSLLAMITGISLIEKRVKDNKQDLLIAAACWLVYLLWIALYQNVIYKSRHVMPLLPFLLIIIAQGYVVILQNKQRFATILASGCLITYLIVTAVLVFQHREPTAIAQIKDDLNESGTLKTVLTIPLIEYYLRSHGVDLIFYSTEDPALSARLNDIKSGEQITVIGDFATMLPGRFVKETDGHRRFFHNPYVNRMWSNIPVATYVAR